MILNPELHKFIIYPTNRSHFHMERLIDFLVNDRGSLKLKTNKQKNTKSICMEALKQIFIFYYLKLILF